MVDKAGEATGDLAFLAAAAAAVFFAGDFLATALAGDFLTALALEAAAAVFFTTFFGAAAFLAEGEDFLATAFLGEVTFLGEAMLLVLLTDCCCRCWLLGTLPLLGERSGVPRWRVLSLATARGLFLVVVKLEKVALVAERGVVCLFTTGVDVAVVEAERLPPPVAWIPVTWRKGEATATFFGVALKETEAFLGEALAELDLAGVCCLTDLFTVGVLGVAVLLDFVADLGVLGVFPGVRLNLDGEKRGSTNKLLKKCLLGCH